MHLFVKDEKKGYQDFDIYENSESKSEGDADNFTNDNPYGSEAPGG